MGDFMDGGADGLHLAHARTDGDGLRFQVEKAVCVLVNGLDFYGYRGCAFQCLQKHLIILYISRQVRGQLGQRLPAGLGHVKDCHRLVHGDFDLFFLSDDLPVRIQHGKMGVRVHLFCLDFLLVRRGRDDLDTVLSLVDAAPKLVPPLVETGN